MMRGDLADIFISSEEFRNKYGIKPPACVNTDDFVIYVDADDFLVGKPIAQHKYWEPHITTIIRRELKPDNTFVDIGANVGWFTLLAASILRHGGRVFAIEPNYNNLQLLYRSIIANRLQNVIVYPYAVTEANHILQLNSARSNGFVSQVGDVGNSTTYVQGVNLDNLLKDEPKIDFIKIDIEGHEPVALKGMQGIIKKHRPLIITEFYPKLIKAYSRIEPTDYIKALIDLDYKLSVIQENGGEISLYSETETLEYWKDFSQKLGTGDLTHIDLVARPI
jgi:FkbM family methyltransferase